MNSIARHQKAVISTKFPFWCSTKSSQVFHGFFQSNRESCSVICKHVIIYQHFPVTGSYQRRRWLSSSPKADKSGHLDTPGKINERGGVWIYIGWTILGLVGVDQALQYKQEQEDSERRQILAQMQLDADNASFNVADWDETLPTIFTCKILHIDPGLDGTKMLTRNKGDRGRPRSGVNKSIKRGDVVEILEAGVGPSQRYHLCRIPAQKSGSNDTNSIAPVIGWYPIDYLERLD